MKGFNKTILIFSIIFGGIAILMIIASLILLVFNISIATTISIISTIMSILLSIAAILYTFISGNETLNLLNKIENQHKKFVAKINEDLLNGAFDESGIEDALTNELMIEKK